MLIGWYSEDSSSSSEILFSYIVSMIFNGIDFERLKSTEMVFDDAFSYRMRTTKASVGFSIYFAEDWQDYKAGDKVPHNLFQYDSYIRDLKVTDLSNYQFSPGPLYALLNPPIPTSGPIAALNKASFKINPELMSLEVDSQSERRDQGFSPVGTLTMKMASDRLVIAEMQDLYQTGGVSFSYDGSEFIANDDSMSQLFYDTDFLIKEDELGSYWEGTYRADITRGDRTVYLSGLASIRQENWADYYCDNSHTQKIGRLHMPYEVGWNQWVFRFSDGQEVTK